MLCAPAFLIDGAGLTRMIHEDSHQNAGWAACGGLQVISAGSHALRDSGRAKPRLRAQHLRPRERLSFSNTSNLFRRPGANPHELPAPKETGANENPPKD